MRLHITSLSPWLGGWLDQVPTLLMLVVRSRWPWAFTADVLQVSTSYWPWILTASVLQVSSSCWSWSLTCVLLQVLPSSCWPWSLTSSGIIFIALIVAVAIQRKREAARPLKDFFHALSHVVFAIVDMMMWWDTIRDTQAQQWRCAWYRRSAGFWLLKRTTCLAL